MQKCSDGRGSLNGSRRIKRFFTGLICVWSLAAVGAVVPPTADWDMIRSRLARVLYESDRYVPLSDERKAELAAQNLENVREARAALTDGKFSDLDYKKRAYQHPTRIYWMALEYAREGGPLERDPQLLADIHLALNDWFVQGYSPGKRWTDAVFRIPRSLYWTALLLGDDLEPKYVPMIGKYTEYDPEQRVGQNRIWVCSHQLYWAAFTENGELADRLSRLVQGELAFQPRGEEGLQYDFSWLQHGPQMYTGGYGLPVIIEAGRVAQALTGSPYAFSDAARGIMAGYVLEGQRWILWRNRIDYSTRGRAIVQPDNLESSPPELRSQFFCTALPIMMDVDPANRSQYEQMLHEMNSQRGESSALVGNRYYPCSDYMVHRGGDWFSSVRMVSTRTHGTEQGHSEGFKNYYMADGGNFLYLSGHEYLNIFPAWDWRKVPGVTCEDSDAPIPYLGWDDRELRRGGSPFCGGVSDGRNGACAMILEKDGVFAHKSWFFMDSGYVCLGAGIKRAGNTSLSTSVNQCLAAGDVVFSDGMQTNMIVGTVQAERPCVIYHDGVSYAFPQAQAVTARVGDQSGYEESIMMDAREGDWRTVDLSQCSKIIKPVFSLYVSHEANAVEGHYSYYVEPSVSKTEAMALLAGLPVNILANTSALQAVQQKKDGLIQAVFYEAGTLDVPNFGQVTSDAPCIVMLRPVENSVRLAVSDPVQSQASVGLTVNGVKKNVSFPAGSSAGMAAEFSIRL